MTRAADLAKLIAGGGTITVDDNSENLKLVTTDADASVGPTLRMDRQSASAADGDLLGKVNFVGHNDAGTPEDIAYAGITAIISDASDGTEDGKLAINTIVAGTERSRIFVDASETVFNEDSIDVDFRVETNSNANMLFVDAENDQVAIGHDSPRAKLDIMGQGTSNSNLSMVIGADEGGTVNPARTNNADKACRIGVPHRENNEEPMALIVCSSTAGVNNVGIGGGTSVLNAATQIVFYTSADSTTTSGSERMRINATGQVLIGTTSSLYSSTQKDGLQIEGAGGGPFVIVSKNVDTSGGANQILFQDGSGDTCGEIASNATNNTTSYGTSSDYRLKENITDVTNAISTFKKLKPKTYNFISDPDNIPEDGFLAHELGAVVPNAVTGEKDAMTSDNKIKPQQVDYGRLTPLLTAALQEAIAKIETLEAKVATLESK